MAGFVLAPEADADLEGIFDYTTRKWGPEQAFKYLSQLNECAEALAAGTARFRKLTGHFAGMVMLKCQHHFIFSRLRKGRPAEIFAIFHERMDLVARLGERLG
jgi:toxin ParE1/3/4